MHRPKALNMAPVPAQPRAGQLELIQVRTAQASPTGTISGPGLDRPFEFARVIP